MQLGNEINEQEFNKWIKALRSGKYKQTVGSLQDENGFCCLGIACKVLSPRYDKNTRGYLSGYLPNTYNGASYWVSKISFDVNEKSDKSLTLCNDALNMSFDEIADLLELIYVHKALD